MLFEASGKIGPLDGARTWRRSRHKIAQHEVPLAHFDVNACLEPGFDLAGVTELAEGDTLHDSNVTQNVSHCQPLDELRFVSLMPPVD